MGILNSAYFFIEQAFDDATDYQRIECFATEEKLKNYIECEFSTTDRAETVNCSIAGLMEGRVFMQSHRMGCGTTRHHVQVIHDTNLSVLYKLLDSAEFLDEDDEPISLSSYLKEAESLEEIEDIIDAFNESRENSW